MSGMCRLCGLRKAEVPDRNTTSPRKRICRECHSKRLLGDFRQIVAAKEAMSNRGPKPDLVREAWCLRYGLKWDRTDRQMPNSLIRQLSFCKTEETRRIILGISK